ncbi:MAG: hypothetical protein H8E35_11720 [Ardenticatenia bacterium]|nr:hypothetical protein [Ardenticatenia bacterium]
MAQSQLLVVKGIFDGERVTLLRPVPFKKRVPVVVTFLPDENWDIETGKEAALDPIQALRGSTKGLRLREKLIEYRVGEREREQRASDIRA